MKLNFWQWLGVLLIVAGIAWWLYGRRAPSTAPPPPAADTPAATAPAR